MIDVRFASEERYCKISIGYDEEGEGSLVACCVDDSIKKYKIQPHMYTTNVNCGREVMVIEYHDDINREAGAIFEEIMKRLEIKKCL
jgi:hypothetical protein